MRLITLPTVWTILLDALVWLVLQPSLSYWVTHLPLAAFDPSAWPYRTFPWEREGKIYEVLFAVRRWKGALPSGGVIFGGFSMKRISSWRRGYLERYLLGTCRAELAHWLQILVSPLFLLWNPPTAALLIFIYALAANLPCIIVQRHNRPRLRRLVGKNSMRALAFGRQVAEESLKER